MGEAAHDPPTRGVRPMAELSLRIGAGKEDADGINVLARRGSPETLGGNSGGREAHLVSAALPTRGVRPMAELSLRIGAGNEDAHGISVLARRISSVWLAMMAGTGGAAFSQAATTASVASS